MPTAERPLVWCPQCANCRIDGDDLYCYSVDGLLVKLPESSKEEPGYCPRYKEREGKAD